MPALDSRTFLVTLGLDAAIGLASCIVFSVLRIVGPTRAFYNPRWYYRTRPTDPPGAPSQQQKTPGDANAWTNADSGSSSTADAATAATSAAAFEAGMDDETGLGGVPPFWAPLPFELPRTLLTWVVPLVQLPEGRLIEAVGLDAAMLLRFIRFALVLLLALSVWCIGVVLPINLQGGQVARLEAAPGAGTAAPSPSPQPVAPSVMLIPELQLGSGGLGGQQNNRPNASSANRAVQVGPGQTVDSLAEDLRQGNYMVTDLDKFGLANIPASSSLLWVHVASVYVVTAITLALLWRATSSALRLYLAHLATPSGTTTGAHHTAVLRDIPGVSKGTLLDHVFHSRLFRLIPLPLKRRLAQSWQLRFGSGAVSKPTAVLNKLLQQQQKLKPGHSRQGKAAAGGSTNARAVAAPAAAVTPAGPVAKGSLGLTEEGQPWQGAASPSPVATITTSSSSSRSTGDSFDRHRPDLVTVTDRRQWQQDHRQQQPDHHQQQQPDKQQQPDHQQDQQQQQSDDTAGWQQDRDQVSILIPPAGSTAVGFTLAQSTRSRKHGGLAQPANSTAAAAAVAATAAAASKPRDPHQYQLQQQQQQQQQEDDGLVLLDGASDSSGSSSSGGRLAAAELLEARRQRMLHGEWRRAAQAMGAADSTSLQEFVEREFATVYGPNSITAVHLVSYSPRTARLVQQYNSTRSALQDLLDHYATQLSRASATASRRKQQQQRGSQSAGSRVLGGAAKPFKAVGRALSLLPPELPRHVTGAGSSGGSSGGSNSGSNCGSSSHQRRLRRDKVKPIKILQLPLPDPAADSEHKAAAAAARRRATLLIADPQALDASVTVPSPVCVGDSSTSRGGGMVCTHAAAAPGKHSRNSSSRSADIHAAASTHPSPAGAYPGTAAQLASAADQTQLRGLQTPEDSWPIGLAFPAHFPAEEEGSLDCMQQQQRPAGGLIHVSSAADLPAPHNSVTAAGPHAAAARAAGAGLPSRNNSSSGDSSSSSLDVYGWDMPCCATVSGRRTKGDALEVLLARLAHIRQQLAEAQAEAESDTYPAALVTFRTRTSLAAAVGAHHVAESGAWSLTAAPAPDSLLWSQVGLRSWQVGFRMGLVRAVLAGVALFYTLPVAAVQALLQLDMLERFPVIGPLVQIPVVRSLLVGVLPGLALRIFVLLLPALLYALNSRAGAVGQAEMDGHVATQFFVLQVLTVFFASFLTGSLINQLGAFVVDPGGLLRYLGTSIPQTATFFLLYITFSAFVGRSLALLRPWGLFMTLCRLVGAKNSGRRGRRRAVLAGTYRMFGPAIPDHSIILLLSVVFCVINPLVMCCGLAFFAMALVVESYNWGYVFRRPYEGGGELWQQVFRHVVITLYLFQGVMIVILAVKQFVWAVLVVVPVVLTAFVHRLGAGFLQRSWGVMSMRAAYELDLLDAAAACQQPAEQQHADAKVPSQQQQQQSAAWGELYRPPGQRVLLQGPGIEARLAQQVAAMQQRLAEHNEVAATNAKRR